MKLITDKHRVKIQTEVYVTLCNTEFTLQNLIDMNCPNFIAARRLEKILKKLAISTIAQLHKLDPMSLYNTRGVGITQLFVAECILHFQGGVSPVRWHKNFIPNPKKKRNHDV